MNIPFVSTVLRQILFAAILGMVVLSLQSCQTKELPFHGFNDAATLEKTDRFVIAETVGGKLDPTKLNTDNNFHSHGGINYNGVEEGYYRWGVEMYKLGYRSWFYVFDLIPQAFRRELLDVHAAAIKAGYKDTEEQNKATN